MQFLKPILVACTTLAMSAGWASAASVYANNIDAISPGTLQDGVTPIPVLASDLLPSANVFDPDNALGPADGLAYSLGFGGSIDLGFGNDFYQEAVIVEITSGRPARPWELALVFVSKDDGTTFQHFATVNGGTTAVSVVNLPAGQFQLLRIRDASDRLLFPTDANGFDLDAVRVNAVPVPAAASMGAALLVGLAAFRSRRASA